MNIDYDRLLRDLKSGVFRQRLEEELTSGFRQIQQSGERLPVKVDAVMETVGRSRRS